MEKKEIDSKVFNSRVTELGLNLDDVAKGLNISTRQVQRYLKEGALPLNKVRKLKSVLNVDSQVASVLYIPMPPKYKLEFRKKWGHKNIDKYSERFEELARALDFLYEIPKFDYSSLIATDISVLTPSDAADVLKKFFSISNPSDLSVIEGSLALRGIPVFYFPFSYLEMPDDGKDFKDLCCVTIFNQADEKLFIVQNSERTEFQVKFDLVHELTHILLAKKFNGDEEDFCNKVAAKFFISEKEIKKRATQINTGSPTAVAQTILSLMDDYQVDFDHALILFKDYNLISKEVNAGLWEKFYKTFKRDQRPIFDTSVKVLDIVFHQRANKTNSVIKKSFSSFLENKMTTRMASFLLGVGPKDLNKFRNEFEEVIN